MLSIAHIIDPVPPADLDRIDLMYGMENRLRLIIFQQNKLFLSGLLCTGGYCAEINGLVDPPYGADCGKSSQSPPLHF